MLVVVSCESRFASRFLSENFEAATIEDFRGMNRGRGRWRILEVDGGGGSGGGGGRQWMVRGASWGSGGRSSFQQDHDVTEKYTESESPSGGRGGSNHPMIKDLEKKSLYGSRPRNIGNERRGNSYWREMSNSLVGSKDDHVGQSHQGKAALESSCGGPAVSASDTGVNTPDLSRQEWLSVHDVDVSKIQISNSQLKGVGKSSDNINDRKSSGTVSQVATRQPSNPGIVTKPDGKEKHISEHLFTSHVSRNAHSEPSESGSYDICSAKSEAAVTLKPSLLEKNREKRNEMKRATEGRRGEILGPGLILLKNHLSILEQAQIVNVCRRLGQGPGGFFQPGYKDGGKLNLKMMCLGKNWDPETSQYVDVRPVDGAKPPPLPSEFTRWVQGAIQESHKLIKLKETGKFSKVENVLPSMSADLCIVNFYTASGRLGLHQDRDESEESLKKGLPVVSFSIGDTAEFLFSEQRNPDEADKVLLESGDVLIFGGKSRHIFHGVERILPNTAPKSLIAETSLRPGRLNLTFRQY